MHSIGRRMSRSLHGQKTHRALFQTLSFVMKGIFSLWRVAAEVQVALVCHRCLLSQPTWQTSGTLATYSELQRRIFPPWFRLGPCPNQTLHIGQVQHVLRMVAAKLRHACAQCWLGDDCSAEKMDYPVFRIRHARFITS